MEPFSSLYFAYGSNLSKQQMLRRTKYASDSFNAKLLDFRLVFRRVLSTDEVYADVEASPGQLVYGVVYQCNSYAIDQLDLYEGVAEGMYTRQLIRVIDLKKEPIDAFVYLGSKAFANEYGCPAGDYLGRILTGAREHNLPEEYIEEIQRIAKNDLE